LIIGTLVFGLALGVPAGAWTLLKLEDRLENRGITVPGLARLKRIKATFSRAQAEAAGPSVTRIHPAWVPVHSPSLGADRASLGPVRPRLLLTPSSLAQLGRSLATPEAAPLRDELAQRCGRLVRARIYWPDEQHYGEATDIAHGYQGDGYVEAALDGGLCYLLSADFPQLNFPPAAELARFGTSLAQRISATTGPHATNPLTDHGYGIRNYGLALAIVHDWFYAGLAPETRTQLGLAMQRWVIAFDGEGFGRNHPVGNYMAGYYLAKVLAALTLQGEADAGQWANAQWEDWRLRLHAQMLQPYFAEHLRGGGWPEGWNYGPRAVINLVLAHIAVRSATGMDLLSGSTPTNSASTKLGAEPLAPFQHPFEQARHLVFNTWPGERTLEDRGVQYASTNPSPTQSALAQLLADVSRLWGDPFAPYAQAYADQVAAVSKEPLPLWQRVVFFNPQPAAPQEPLRPLPLSYAATGMQTLAARSNWTPAALWFGFTAGTHVENPDSGEMSFDQGAFTLVSGNRCLVCNATAALLRHSPGTEDGANLDDALYNMLFGEAEGDPKIGKRDVYNILYAGASTRGQGAYGPTESSARMTAAIDVGAAVYARAEDLHTMYRPLRRGERQRPLKRWSREVLYVRPDWVIARDESETAPGITPTWLAYHLAGKVAVSPTTDSLIDASPATVLSTVTASNLSARLTAYWPLGARLETEDLRGLGKLTQVRLLTDNAHEDTVWLTDVQAAPQSETPTAHHDLGATWTVLSQPTRRMHVVISSNPSSRHLAPAAVTVPLDAGDPVGTHTVLVMGEVLSATLEANALRLQLQSAGPADGLATGQADGTRAGLWAAQIVVSAATASPAISKQPTPVTASLRVLQAVDLRTQTLP
jgi:hypothetical protein